MDCEILGQAKQSDFSPAFNLSGSPPPFHPSQTPGSWS